MRGTVAKKNRKRSKKERRQQAQPPSWENGTENPLKIQGR